jgi:hypothetical protein
MKTEKEKLISELERLWFIYENKMNRLIMKSNSLDKNTRNVVREGYKIFNELHEKYQAIIFEDKEVKK